jgi:class 3 adenylate cyclase
MAVFHSVPAALDFALDLAADTNHDSVRIRVGVHVGLVLIDGNDVYGQAVNMAARVEAKAVDGGIWVSQRAKEDIDAQKADRHAHLQWTAHQDQQLKGLIGPFTLWSL